MTHPLVASLGARALQRLQARNLLQPLLRAEILSESLAGVALSDQEQREARQLACQHLGLTDSDAEHRHYRNQGMDEAAWQWQCELRLRVQRHSLDAFGGNAEHRFLQVKDRLDQVTYKLIRVRNPGLAQELYLRLSDGETSFALLAEAYSEGAERDRGGLVGPVPLEKAHPLLAERLRQTSPGSLLEPFSIQDWWLVVQLKDRNPARFNDATRLQLTQELYEEWVQEQIQSRMDSLLKALDSSEHS